MKVVKISEVAGVPFIRDGFQAEEYVHVDTDIDAFLEKVNNQPKYGYLFHAYSFYVLNLTMDKMNHVLDVAKETNLPLRVWSNDQSGCILFCFADPDMSEDSGWSVYERMQSIEYDSYGMPSGYEWEMYGLDVDPNAPLTQTSERAFTIGEVGIIV